MIPLLLAGLALGQERFSLDPVYVARFDAPAGAEAEAEAARLAVEATLGTRHLVIPREDVPDYEDYDAETYQAACPPGERLGCAWVVGERAAAEWVLSGVLDGEVLRLDVVDVEASQVLLGVELPADDSLAERVAAVLDLVIYAEAEARGEDPTAEAARLREAALAELEAEIGDLRARPEVRLRRPRLSTDDLAEWEEREDAAPWQSLGMGQGEYLRFKNSGMPLDTWRSRSRGRAGRVSASVTVGAARGPLSTHLDARWALDGSLAVIGVEELAEVRDGASSVAALALAVGLHPILEVEVAGAWRSAIFGWRFHDEVVGERFEAVPPSTSRLTSAWQLAARARAVPLPRSRVRPTAAAGVAVLWTPEPGAQVALGEFMEPLPRHRLVLAELRPGAELTASSHLVLFAELGVGLLVAGGAPAWWSQAPEALTQRAEPEGHGAATVEGAVGVRVLSGPLGRRGAAVEEEP